MNKNSAIDALLSRLRAKVEQRPTAIASGLAGRGLTAEELLRASGGVATAGKGDTITGRIYDDATV